MRESKTNSLIIKLILIILLIVGLFYRIYGLNDNHSFWTDENHLAIFVRAILERGRPVLTNGYHTGIYQIFPYYLSALSAKIFGLNEFAIRFPSVIFGVLTIWAVYLVGKELFNKNVGLVATALTTFLKIEILWSRQARPYQALQFFFLLSALFIYKLSKKDDFDWRYFLGFLAVGTIATLFHGLGLVIFFTGFLYLLLLKPSWLKNWLVVFPGIAGILLFGYFFRQQLFFVLIGITKVNNLFYYRVFLWHNYPLLIFLALVGFLSLFFSKKGNWHLPVLFLITQGIIASFLLGQPLVRYFYPVFPFLILLSAVGLVGISQYISSFATLRKYPIAHFVGFLRNANIQYLILFTLSFFIIALGHKFTLFPQKVYSLNEDMQEIPEVDWKKVYNFVGEKLSQDEDIILITNWNDLPVWFLGENQLGYLLRKRGPLYQSEKDPFSSAVFIESIEHFQEVVKTNKKGVLVLDSWDDRVPEGVREYSRKNLKKELEIDRLYPVQPRYWPVEVYSWGI